MTDALRAALVDISHALYARHLVSGLAGNVSVRCDDGTVLATPTATRKSEVKGEQLVRVTLSGEVLEGERPSSELAMHLGIYRTQVEARAVVHAHPAHATALGLVSPPLRVGATAEGIADLGPVARVPYARPGTSSLASVVARAAETAKVVLLRHHGAVTWGATLEEAFARMDTLEHVARVMLAYPGGPLVTPQLDDSEGHTLRQLAGFTRQPLTVIEIAEHAQD